MSIAVRPMAEPERAAWLQLWRGYRALCDGDISLSPLGAPAWYGGEAVTAAARLRMLPHLRGRKMLVERPGFVQCPHFIQP